MASIARRDDGRWRAWYRDPAGREHAKHFTRRPDVQRWLDDVVTAANTGAWVDPARAQVTVAEWAKDWLEGAVTPQAQLVGALRRRPARARAARVG